MGPLIARDALVTKWIDIEEKLEMLAGGKTNLTITQNVEPVSLVCAHPPTRCRYSTSGLGGFSMSDYIDTYYW